MVLHCRERHYRHRPRSVRQRAGRADRKAMRSASGTAAGTCWSRPLSPAALPRPSTTSSGSRRLPAPTCSPGRPTLLRALFATGSDAVLFPGFTTGFTTSSDISSLANQFEFGGSLTFPGSSAGVDPAYFGPNFRFDDATPVPEPASLLLLGARPGADGAARLSSSDPALNRVRWPLQPDEAPSLVR